VVCLDDESPTSSTERYTHFLLNGLHRPFNNRWLDKTVQLVVTANSLSAETYEHAKLDGLDVRSLHAHLLYALRQDSAPPPLPTEENPPVRIQKHGWKNISPAIAQRIEHIQHRWRAFGPLDHRVVDVPRLSLDALRAGRAPPNAAAHLTALLALRLVDGKQDSLPLRPAWENVSLGPFARGRIEWVQTVSEATRDFIVEAAAAADAVTDPWDERDNDGNSMAGRQEKTARLRTLFHSAAASYARALVDAGRGHGVVGPMYALHFAVNSAAANETNETNIPALFRSRAWEATRRGGPGQDVKLGFARFVPDDFDADDDHWDAGGFLMRGERGIYIHCGVRTAGARFAVSARPEYAAKVCEALGRAGGIIAGVLDLPWLPTGW
jgi:hypothetical protein